MKVYSSTKNNLHNNFIFRFIGKARNLNVGMWDVLILSFVVMTQAISLNREEYPNNIWVRTSYDVYLYHKDDPWFIFKTTFWCESHLKRNVLFFKGIDLCFRKEVWNKVKIFLIATKVCCKCIWTSNGYIICHVRYDGATWTHQTPTFITMIDTW